MQPTSAHSLRTYYRFAREDIAVAYLSAGWPAPLFFDCPCGCESFVAYARDPVALWVTPGLTAEEDRLLTIGLRSGAEVTLYCDMVEEVTRKHEGSIEDVDLLRMALMSALAGRN